MNGLLIRSLEAKHLVEIIYSNNEGRLTQRVITVIEITDWHIKAYCHLRHNIRMFKRDHILSMVPYKRKNKYKGIS